MLLLAAALIWGIPEYRKRTLGAVTHEEMVGCATAADCVPAECSGHCSGCGGFSFEEIINKKSEKAWYYQKGCRKPLPGEMLVPMVCCSPGEIVCAKGNCAFLPQAPNPAAP